MLAVLYFALMELLLLDSSRQLIEAQRFRARVIASNLAESGAELAAEQIFIAYNNGKTVTENDWQGDMSGSLTIDEGGAFTIEAKGTSAGVVRTTAHVTVWGMAKDGNLSIEFTDHGPE
ncbi:MAG TPA: hypothetical protein VMU84_14505 [Thermoanaerobaculia bacterium]|nr:hypothetical protein [Thermoanaerobaculia bacterium]